MKLVIVESPAKAKTIEKYLGKGYAVRASVGHIRDLPKSNKDAVDVASGFVPRYHVVREKQHVIDALHKEAGKAEEVILATDPDREGEAIAWHVAETIGLKSPKRIVFSEITERAVQEALANPRGIDDELVKAQEARRVLDRLFGYDLSGLVWKKVRYGLSAGRVQSPALRIILEREREIRAFKPEDYFVISAILETPRKDEIRFLSSIEPKTEKESEEILKNARANRWKVENIEAVEQNRYPKPPFITSTLQQAASSRLGLSPGITMRLAQKLYEGGHITYMRTDSTNLGKAAQDEIQNLIARKYGKPYASPKVYKTKSKNAQEAHEAIRPTHVMSDPKGLSDKESRLYKLIWERTVSSQMTEAKMLKTKISACTTNQSVPIFEATGQRILFDGWLRADPAARGEEVELPKTEKGESLTLKNIESEAKRTEPPHRYSEAGLIKELEKRDIGRPSTYATIIQTLLGRSYVEKKDRSLVPTATGEVVSQFLEEHFGSIISDTFTAEMEEDLDSISRGEKNYLKTLKDFYGPFSEHLASKHNIPKVTNLGEAPKEMTCPTCQGPMIIKLGKNGKFLSCAKYPSCEGTRSIEGRLPGEKEKPKSTGIKCAKCKEGELVERKSRFGIFYGCSRYPACKHILKKIDSPEPNAENR